MNFSQKKIINKNSHEVFIYIICVALATLMWVLNTMDKEHSTTTTVSVAYVGIPDYIEFENPLVQTLSVELHGNARDLFLYSHKHLEIVFDLSNQFVEEDGEVSIPPTMIRGQIEALLNSETRLVQVVPEIINESFHPIITEKVFKIPIVVRDVPAHERVMLFPNEATVTVQVGMNHFQMTSAASFRAFCKYPMADESSLKVVVESNNPYILKTDVEPKEVEFLIEHN